MGLLQLLVSKYYICSLLIEIHLNTRSAFVKSVTSCFRWRQKWVTDLIASWNQFVAISGLYIPSVLKHIYCSDMCVRLKRIVCMLRFVLSNEQKMRPDYYTSAHGPTSSAAHTTSPVSYHHIMSKFYTWNRNVYLLLGLQAAVTVSRFLSKQADRIRDSLDGANLTAALTELGIRFHRVVVDHIYSCQFSMNGQIHTSIK